MSQAEQYVRDHVFFALGQQSALAVKVHTDHDGELPEDFLNDETHVIANVLVGAVMRAVRGEDLSSRVTA